MINVIYLEALITANYNCFIANSTYYLTVGVLAVSTYYE